MEVEYERIKTRGSKTNSKGGEQLCEIIVTWTGDVAVGMGKNGAFKIYQEFPCWLRGLRICLQCRRPRFDPSVRMNPWRRE